MTLYAPDAIDGDGPSCSSTSHVHVENGLGRLSRQTCCLAVCSPSHGTDSSSLCDENSEFLSCQRIPCILPCIRFSCQLRNSMRFELTIKLTDCRLGIGVPMEWEAASTGKKSPRKRRGCLIAIAVIILIAIVGGAISRCSGGGSEDL